MDITQHISLHVNKGEFEFVFHMPTGATWGAAMDAAFEILQKLSEQSQKSVAAMQPAQPEVAAEQPAVEAEVMPEG